LQLRGTLPPSRIGEISASYIGASQYSLFRKILESGPNHRPTKQGTAVSVGSLYPSRRRQTADAIHGRIQTIKNFQSRSRPERPILLRQSLEKPRGETACPYIAFESS